MKIAALFAGIGGLELGLSRAGHTTALTCEIWEPARLVLSRRFRDVPNFEDVRDLRSLPSDVELLTAGFPCQDLSQAGLTAGIGGAKSGLVSNVFRLIDDRRIPVVLLENVSFMLQLDKGAAMDRLTKEFEARGYRWAYRTVSTLAFLPQRRERVFFVATRNDLDPSDVLFSDDIVAKPVSTHLDTHAHGFYWTEGVRGLGWAADAIPTLKNGSTVGIPSPPAILMPDGRVIKPDIRDAERLQGFPEGWTESAPYRYRWSLLGNAVSVPVAEWVGRRLAEPGVYSRDRDRPWRSIGRSFPSAAYFDGSERREVSIGKFPVWRERDPLHLFLKYQGQSLSVRATAGFLKRARRSSLRFTPGFLERLEAHLEAMRGRAGSEDASHGPVPGLVAAE